MNTRFAILATGCAGLLVGAAIVAMERPAPREPRSPQRSDDRIAGLRAPGLAEGSGGIARLEIDAANAIERDDAGAWLPGHGASFDELEHAQSVEALMLTHPEWIDTAVELEVPPPGSPFARAEVRCREQHLATATGRCDVGLHLGIERTGDRTGTVVAARRQLADASSVACDAYAECLIEDGWLRRAVPLAAGDQTRHAFSWNATVALDDAEDEGGEAPIAELGAAVPDQLAALADQLVEEDGADGFQVRRLRALADYYRWLGTEAADRPG
jgi:hypothetical protein